MTRRAPMTAEERAFVQGAAIALGILGRAGHNRPGTAADIAREMGLTLADFKRARCEPYDLKPFRRELRRLEERARVTRPDTTKEPRP